ncbi:MAG: ABC transporter substrate-binding protein, partial [Anaerolineae bacterium]|nr:ABC transporter substrate-binding protein [Anaerolineae bacterium]
MATKRSLLALLVMTALVLTGCRGEAGPTSPPPTRAPGEPIVLE